MTDKTDDDSGWKPREAKPDASGERRVYKARPLGEAQRPSRDAKRPPRDDKPRDDKPRTDKSRDGDAPRGRDRSAAPKPRPLGDARSDRAPAGKSYPRSFDTEAPGMERSDARRSAPAGGDARPLRSVRSGPREDASSDVDGTMRIAKRLARAGIASRRDAEGMIADGRVKLNGKLLDSPAVNVTMRDKIEIDNNPLPQIERTRLWLFHKPAGTVTTNRDPEGRPTVFDRLPEDLPRVLSVGRLDINTEGLLLLTNDGGLARILELPATGWLRRYRVRAFGSVTQAQLDELRQGIAIDGVFYGAIEASLDSEKGHNVWLTLGLREGKNREVKRILGHLGLDVNRLIRLSFGPFQLGDLPEGAVREIKGRMLRDQLGDRLIEESGADFDAPIVNTFTNETVKAEKPAEPPKKSEWVSAAVERPNKRKFGDAKRVDALGRLDTKPGRPGADRNDARGERKPFVRGDRPERSDRPQRSDARPPRGDAPRGEATDGAEGAEKRPGAPRRMANVWMAPGARPIGEKKAAVREAKSRDRDRPKPTFGKSARDDGDRPKRSSAPGRIGDRTNAQPAGEAPRGRPRDTGARGNGPSRGGEGGGRRPDGGPKRGPR